MFLFQWIERKNEEIEGYKKETILRAEEIKKKDCAIKGLQEIIKKEQQQSHQEKLKMQERHNAQ